MSNELKHKIGCTWKKGDKVALLYESGYWTEGIWVEGTYFIRCIFCGALCQT